MALQASGHVVQGSPAVSARCSALQCVAAAVLVALAALAAWPLPGTSQPPSCPLARLAADGRCIQDSYNATYCRGFFHSTYVFFVRTFEMQSPSCPRAALRQKCGLECSYWCAMRPIPAVCFIRPRLAPPASADGVEVHSGAGAFRPLFAGSRAHRKS